MMKRSFFIPVSMLLLVYLTWIINDSSAAQSFIYASPHPEAQYVSTETTIVFRYKQSIDVESLFDKIHITGEKSGFHQGEIKLVSSGTTLIFIPNTPFLPDETVQVHIKPGILTSDGTQLAGDKYQFKTSIKTQGDTYTSLAVEILKTDFVEPSTLTNMQPLSLLNFVTDDIVTIPSDYPPISVTVPANETDDGLIFLSNFTIDWGELNFNESIPYLLILDDSGEPVFYRKTSYPAFDFKMQPNGLLTYFLWGTGKHYALDSTYQIVDSFVAGNGYIADGHEFQLLPNGHSFLQIYDFQPVDMSKIVPGGNPNAFVAGLIIQELDNDKNVIFEWRSWDHIPITDSVVDLTASVVDYVHGNSIELDTDGNIIISSRGLDEVTKINRQTGEIIWRMGAGPGNEFTFINDESMPMSDQHDARRLPNGNITIFDNRIRVPGSTFARGTEYEINEVTKTAEPVWQYRSQAPSPAMGNMQRLSNGNSMIGWGSSYPSLTEVKQDGTVALELQFGKHSNSRFVRNSYRAFRFPWQGFPTWPPRLVSIPTSPSKLDFYFSWNGATNVASYQVLGGMTNDSLSVITSVPKTSFETHFNVDDDDTNCIYKVVPIMEDGNKGIPSNFVLADRCVVTQLYFPLIFSN